MHTCSSLHPGNRFCLKPLHVNLLDTLMICSKIDEAVDAGDTPYELNTEQKAVRRPKPVKKALSKKERSKRK